VYKLTIRAQTKSRAKLIGGRKKTNHFIVGRKYDINYVVKNIGEEKSPSGRIYIHIKWPGTTTGSRWEFTIEPLEPGECHTSETKTYLAFSTGLATIMAYDRIRSGSHELQNVVELIIFRKDGKRELDKKEAFDTIFATTPEAIYEYYALWVAAIGLIIIASEIIWNALRFFLSLASCA